MTRYQIQLLRYIGLRPVMSARCMGIRKRELTPLFNEGLVLFGPNKYAGRSLALSKKGKEFLASLQADTYGNPEWDDEVFAGMMSRNSLFITRKDANEN